MSFIEPWQLRARFARSLSDMYGREVPAYTTLVDVSHEVNEAVVRAQGADAERLGSIDRGTAERRGARSAAGLFQSNLTDGGSHDAAQQGAALDAGWMAGVLGHELADPISLYATQRARSLDVVRWELSADTHFSRS